MGAEQLGHEDYKKPLVLGVGSAPISGSCGARFASGVSPAGAGGVGLRTDGIGRAARAASICCAVGHGGEAMLVSAIAAAERTPPAPTS